MTVPKKPGLGRINEERSFWCRLNAHHEYVIYKGEYEGDTEPGDAVRLLLSNGRNRITLNLTQYTEPELLVFKKLVDKAVELALPVCQLRDETAKENWENGDTSYTRMYREIPRLIARPRKKQQHDSGVPVGPVELPYDDPIDSDTGVPRSAIDILAERGTGELESENDGPETDKSTWTGPFLGGGIDEA